MYVTQLLTLSHTCQDRPPYIHMHTGGQRRRHKGNYYVSVTCPSDSPMYSTPSATYKGEIGCSDNITAWYNTNSFHEYLMNWKHAGNSAVLTARVVEVIASQSLYLARIENKAKKYDGGLMRVKSDANVVQFTYSGTGTATLALNPHSSSDVNTSSCYSLQLGMSSSSSSSS